MDIFYNKVCFQISKLITKEYSTSFSIGVRSLHPSLRDAIYGIYGFVRLADEIVDSFHEYDKEDLLNEFEKEYRKAITNKISLNPVLNAFQSIIHQYQIDEELVTAFLLSMRSDLHNQALDEEEIDTYIYGSAEVVGLMCLHVFVKGDRLLYQELAPFAKSLGAAFQKVNFLRDLQHDSETLKRTYFPLLKENPLDDRTKKILLEDIYQDFQQALIGIKRLPKESRFGVYIAYLYYLELTKKIERAPVAQLLQERIRVTNTKKMIILCRAYIKSKIFS